MPATALTLENKLALCQGCHDNFYNGNNLGVKACWSLDSAEPVRRKFVHLNDRPPWDSQDVVDTLHCHRRPRHVSVAPEVTC